MSKLKFLIKMFWYLIFIFYYLFIYLFLVVLSLCCCTWTFSSCSGGAILLQCMVFSLRGLLLLQSTGSRPMSFCNCSLRALEGSLSSCGVRAYWHLPWTRDQTHVPCTGRWILIHCITREGEK